MLLILVVGVAGVVARRALLVVLIVVATRRDLSADFGRRWERGDLRERLLLLVRLIVMTLLGVVAVA